jgi:hypothetical protein
VTNEVDTDARTPAADKWLAAIESDVEGEPERSVIKLPLACADMETSLVRKRHDKFVGKS